LYGTLHRQSLIALAACRQQPDEACPLRDRIGGAVARESR